MADLPSEIWNKILQFAPPLVQVQTTFEVDSGDSGVYIETRIELSYERLCQDSHRFVFTDVHMHTKQEWLDALERDVEWPNRSTIPIYRRSGSYFFVPTAPDPEGLCKLEIELSVPCSLLEAPLKDALRSLEEKGMAFAE